MTDPKRFSTLQALAALAGYALTSFRVDEHHWSYALTSHLGSTEFDDLDEIEDWLSTTGREAVNA